MYCIIKGAMIVKYAVKLMEMLIVVLLLNCGGFGKLQHFTTSYSVTVTSKLNLNL